MEVGEAGSTRSFETLCESEEAVASATLPTFVRSDAELLLGRTVLNRFCGGRYGSKPQLE